MSPLPLANQAIIKLMFYKKLNWLWSASATQSSSKNYSIQNSLGERNVPFFGHWPCLYSSWPLSIYHSESTVNPTITMELCFPECHVKVCTVSYISIPAPERHWLKNRGWKPFQLRNLWHPPSPKQQGHFKIGLGGFSWQFSIGAQGNCWQLFWTFHFLKSDPIVISRCSQGTGYRVTWLVHVLCWGTIQNIQSDAKTQMTLRADAAKIRQKVNLCRGRKKQAFGNQRWKPLWHWTAGVLWIQLP